MAKYMQEMLQIWQHHCNSNLRFQVWQKFAIASQVNSTILPDFEACFKDLQGPSSFSSTFKALSLPLYSRTSGDAAYRQILLQTLDTYTADLLRRIHIWEARGKVKSGNGEKEGERGSTGQS